MGAGLPLSFASGHSSVTSCSIDISQLCLESAYGLLSILVHRTVACSKGGNIELWTFLATVAGKEKRERQEVRVCVSSCKNSPQGYDQQVRRQCEGITNMIELWISPNKRNLRDSRVTRETEVIRFKQHTQKSSMVFAPACVPFDITCNF